MDLGTEAVKFALMGQDCNLSINDFNQFLGMATLVGLKTEGYKSAARGTPEQTPAEWAQKSEAIGRGGEFKSGATKAYELKNGALRICHRILAYNFFGKKDSSNSIAQLELFLLWCMVTGKKVNFGAYAINHFRDISSHPKQRISLAHLVSILAKSLGIIDEAATGLTSLQEKHLDLPCLQRMQEVEWDEQEKSLRFIWPAQEEAPTNVKTPATSRPPKRMSIPPETGWSEILEQLTRIEDNQVVLKEKLDATYNALMTLLKGAAC